MPNYTIYALGAANISVSGGGSLSGFTQGDGSHLRGKTITLNTRDWTSVAIRDDESYFADNDGNQVLDGAQTIFGRSYTNGRVVEAEYTVTVRTPTGETYKLIGLNINEPGSSYSAFGTIEGLAFIGNFPPIGVPLTVVTTAEGPGASITLANTYAVPCFVAGTLVDTADGPRPVESLSAGDLVWTLDAGLQPLRQALSTFVDAERLQVERRLRPVRIPAGAFGQGVPAVDVLVSPQHRVLIDDWRAAYFWGEDQVLVPAIALVDGRRVRQIDPTPGVTYVHLVFDRHQVVSASGLLSESFFPGVRALAALSPEARAEFDMLFPDFVPVGPAQLARPEVRGREARLAARWVPGDRAA